MHKKIVYITPNEAIAVLAIPVIFAFGGLAFLLAAL